jgi:cytochrome c oxidase subunit 3
MASGHATDHDYHIIPPSPWPLVGSISALVMAIGTVIWFHGGTWVWFGLGLLGVLYTMVMWWRDVDPRERSLGITRRLCRCTCATG